MSYRCSLPSTLQERSKEYKFLSVISEIVGDVHTEWRWARRSGRSLRKSSKNMGLCGAQGRPPLGSGTNAILFNPWISSAMAMAMSIYRTLCVLVPYLLTFNFSGPLGASQFMTTRSTQPPMMNRKKQ